MYVLLESAIYDSFSALSYTEIKMVTVKLRAINETLLVIPTLIRAQSCSWRSCHLLLGTILARVFDLRRKSKTSLALNFWKYKFFIHTVYSAICPCTWFSGEPNLLYLPYASHVTKKENENTCTVVTRDLTRIHWFHACSLLSLCGFIVSNFVDEILMYYSSNESS